MSKPITAQVKLFEIDLMVEKQNSENKIDFTDSNCKKKLMKNRLNRRVFSPSIDVPITLNAGELRRIKWL